MKRIRHTMLWLFTAPEEPLTPRRIVGWWELRRIPFNVILGIIGFASLLLFTSCIENAGVLQPGEDAVEPLAIVVVPLLANAAYTGGWLIDCPLRLIRPTVSPRFTPLHPASPRASFASGSSFHSSSSPFPPSSGAATASCSSSTCCADFLPYQNLPSASKQRCPASSLPFFGDLRID